jgi:uncharacterized membrane-anchored protein
MIDLHLINMALAGIGIAAAAAVMLATLMLAVAYGLRSRRQHGPRQHDAGIPAASTARTALRAPREPALR